MFVFDALHSEDRALSFDYFDALDGPFVCVRSGPTFVVGFLQVFGAVHGLGIEDGPDWRPQGAFSFTRCNALS